MAETAGSLYLMDAETGDTSQFTSTTESGTNTFRADDTAEDHGTYGFKLALTNSTATAYGLKTFTDNDTEWHRFYIYIDPAIDLNSNYAQLYLFKLADGFTTLCDFGIYSQASGTPTKWFFGYKSADVSSTNFSTGAWHLIEIKWVRHASTGGVLLYVDGSLILSDVNQDTSAEYADRIYVGKTVSYGANPDNGNYVYFDDIRGNDTQNGAYSDASTNWTKDLSETATLSDSLTSSVELNKSDTASLSDSLSNAVELNKADTTILSDNLINSFGMSIADSIVLSDILSNAYSLNRDDSIVLSDDITKGISINKADLLTLSEAIGKGLGLNKADTLTLTDNLTKALGGDLFLNLSDNLTLSELLSSILSAFVSITDISTAEFNSMALSLSEYNEMTLTSKNYIDMALIAEDSV